MTPEEVGNLLAPVNAGLNLSSTLFLLGGLWLIKGRRVRAHRAAMTGAVVSSALFLLFYVLRFSLTGTHRFAGEGSARTFYLGILFSHMVLAVIIVPLVLRLLYLVWKSRFHSHARLARWTYPVWLYVSVTGLLVYILLYHVYGYL
jgi:putative membrane protein